MKYLTVENIVANAYTLCDGATDADQLFMRQWAFIGNRELGLSKDNVQNEKIYATDLAIAKPENLLSTDELTLYTINDDIIGSRYIGYGQRTKAKDELRQRYVTITEDDTHFHLSSDAKDSVNYALIRYYGIPVDKEGMPMILERKRYALMLFIRYMWSLRVNRNQSEVAQNEMSWLKEAKKQRAKNKMPSIQEANSMMRWYMSLISAPSPISY